MSAYLQRLFDRAAASPALGQVTPAGPSRSPVAEADQRLNEPGLADLFSFTGSPGPGEIEGLENLGPDPAAPAPLRPRPAPQLSAAPAPAGPRNPTDGAVTPAPQNQAAETPAVAPPGARPPFRSVGAVAPEDFVPPEPIEVPWPAMPPEPATATARAPPPTAEPPIPPGADAPEGQAPPPQSAFVAPPRPDPSPAFQAEPKPAQAPPAPPTRPLREIVREVIRAEAPRQQAPTPRRPMTAAEASAIGPLTAEPRARTLFGLRKR